MPLLRAPVLVADAVRHGFTTRHGGVSPTPFDTLNLGRGVGDHPDRVAANRERALEAVECDPVGHVEAAQVHGRAVAVVGRGQRGEKIAGADALLTTEPGVVLAIHTADCVPILLWDLRRGAIGAVHAGWRGTAVGVAAAAVEEMTRSFETDPADLRVAMGPAVG
ncbi:MAG TPA: polyphenol oxidase family protein, partial [bacterium]|nr:polyphenol oxidase family protein [bacterium]